MKNLVITVVFMLLGTLSFAAKAQQSYDDVDREMVELLNLNHGQAQAYVAIMHKQRKAFAALKTRDWQRELPLYQETFAMLKPVLTERQYTQFVGIINSVIEDTEGEDYREGEEYLAMEDQGCSFAVCETGYSGQQ